jgi:hypothetical protein
MPDTSKWILLAQVVRPCAEVYERTPRKAKTISYGKSKSV